MWLAPPVAGFVLLRHRIDRGATYSPIPHFFYTHIGMPDGSKPMDSIHRGECYIDLGSM